MKKISLKKLPFKSFIISIAILLTIILSVWIYFDIFSFQKQNLNKIKATVLNEKKIYLKTIVSSIVNYINYQSNSIEKRLTAQLKEETNKAYNIVSHLYSKYKNSMPKDKLEKLIIESLRPIRYNKGLGYFFAFNSKGLEKLFADRPEFEGKNLLNIKDAKGNSVLKNMIKIAKTKGEGFYTYYWTKPHTNSLEFNYKKKAYIKYFKPLDLILGTGLYYDDIENLVKEIVKNFINQYRFGKNMDNYVFVAKLLKKANKFKLIRLVNPNSKKSTYNKEISLNIQDIKGKFFRKEMLKKCLTKGSGFVTYYYKKLNYNKVSEKLTYVKYYKKWNWIIGAGVYFCDLHKIILKQKNELINLLNKKLIITFFILFIAFWLAFYTFRRHNQKIELELNKLFSILRKKDYNFEPNEFNIKEFSVIAKNLKSFFTKIEEQNEILQAYYNKPHILNFVVNEQGYFDMVNKSFEQITGYLENEAQKMKFFEIIHPDFKELVRERGYKRLKGENMPPEYDIKIITKHGETKWVKLINNHIHLKTKNKNILLGTAIDITEQKELMEKLNEQYNLFKTLIDSLNIPIWIFDVEKNIFTMVNKYFYEYFEIEENIIGKHPQECFSENIYKKSLEGNKIVRETKKKISYENSIKLKKGVRKILVTKSPLFNKEGVVIGIMGISVDLTEKLKMERLKNIESLGVLAGGIAHDFNNILAAIMGNINLLQIYVKEDKPLKILSKLENSVLRAQKLTKKLLTFSKGSFLIKESANIAEIVKEVSEFVTTGTSIKIEYSLEENLPEILIDKEQFSEVIHNIILNARQSMEKSGGNFIYISINRKFINEKSMIGLKTGEYIEITIEDTGEGINYEIMENIFDPYFTTKKDGSGLGLATSYSIIKQHGGIINVESGEKGAKFSIYLPVITEDKEKSLVKKDNNTQEIEKYRNKKFNILVLEDEEDIRNMLKEMINYFGYNVTFAANGEEAIEIFKNGNFDLVITDITIKGGMGGLKAAEKIREYKKDIYIVASTGYTDSNIAENYQKYGFNNILLKPYNIEKLKKIFEN